MTTEKNAAVREALTMLNGTDEAAVAMLTGLTSEEIRDLGGCMTEAEWRQREARRECAAYGHDWNIVQTGAGVPIALTCERPCGARSYNVIPTGSDGAS